MPTTVGVTTAGGAMATGCPGIVWIIGDGLVNVCGMAMPGGGIVGATVTTGGAMAAANGTVGFAIPDKSVKKKKQNVFLNKPSKQKQKNCY